ncbi:MAG TPA: low specificity L-threonine aldolase [Candidatus Faecivicinus avistercoris]|nr:low specificity L-threonine aldolase [Candidatus Faecivicinus avistercoris]
MIRFGSDYQEGAHPRILKRLAEVNFEQSPGYGEDEFCAEARRLIREKCAAPEADVQFLVGGTQTNFTLLAAALRPHQGVIAADSGHIAVHETGAVEACGHKVIELPAVNGKLAAGQVSEYCRRHFADDSHEHMVMPGAVYISNPTELGTLYTRGELNALRGVCDHWNLMLYLDGARLGCGLASPENELDLPFLASVCDAFSIGGTKQGALFGEALVLLRDDLKRDFRYILKQRGGMLAKGWLLGLQFAELMRDGLYEELSDHAIHLAMRIRRALREANVSFLVDSPTNQQFPIFTDEQVRRLSAKYAFSDIRPLDDGRTAVRICTSWATRPEDVDQLIADIRAELQPSR